jgi:hypothetical protein
MTTRNYVNGAPLVTLAVGVDASAVTLEVASTSGYPTVPFVLALERGTVNEEVVLCTSKSSTTFTVTRGWDGTTGKAHSAGAACEHTTAAIDYTEANEHHNSTGDVHAQYILKSGFTAKGQVLVATGSGAFTALAVGADGLVPVASAAAASGIAWGTIGTAGITDLAVTEAKLATLVKESIIRKLGASPTVGEGIQYFNTGDSRWYGYRGAWKKMTFGAGEISWGTAAASGGTDGDIYFKL